MRSPGILRMYFKTLVLLTLVAMAIPRPAGAASRAEIDRDVKFALQKLYDGTPSASMLAQQAKGILVFPDIVKGGFIVGAQTGKGALLVHGATKGYYRTTSVSYGLQAGVQTYGYALFFMTDAALNYLQKSQGWEIGVGPSVVIVDAGLARSLTTTTAKDDIYAFIFDQKGLMAGLGLQGTKVSRIKPK